MSENMSDELRQRIQNVESSLEPKTKKQPRAYDDDTLGAINGWEAALATVAQDHAGEIEEVSDYGSGFVVLPKKDCKRLCGVPFVILEWSFNPSEYDPEQVFVSAMIVTKQGEKLVINDGSTGIREQLQKITAKRIGRGANEVAARTGLMCRDGLRVSEYDYVDPDTGKITPATTFYLA